MIIGCEWTSTSEWQDNNEKIKYWVRMKWEQAQRQQKWNRTSTKITRMNEKRRNQVRLKQEVKYQQDTVKKQWGWINNNGCDKKQWRDIWDSVSEHNWTEERRQ